MAKNDWYEAGEEIKNLVQDAVDRQDFSQLSATITNVVNQTVDGFQNALKDSLNGINTAGSGQSSDDRKPYQEAANRIRRDMENKHRQRRQETEDNWQRSRSRQPDDRGQQQFRGEIQPVRPPKLKVPGRVSGIVMASVGYSFSGMFGLALAILGVLSYTTGAGLSVACGILGVLFGGSLCIGIGGSRRLGQVGRFRRYMGLLKERTYCTVEELASGIGKSKAFVKKDLKKMIRKGFFPEGHLDRNVTCLMTDHETYQQYLLTQKEYDRRMEEQESQKKTRKKDQKKNQNQSEEQDSSQENGRQSSEYAEKRDSAALSSECRALLDEGNRYIRHIRECNDRIPGEEISAKLDRLELVVSRIFREVERRPELAPELRKMMSYYLPTTQKLLDAYCELDAQVIKGQNIDTTKKEIEDSLDTINTAFENLLDSFFENTAWDISADISVLHTMFAQEGLTGKDFEDNM